MKAEIEKWMPILETIGIKNNVETIALYCEKHCKYEIEAGTHVRLIPTFHNVLPICLKILSKLNLDNKKLELVNESPTGMLKVIIESDIADCSISLLDVVESAIVEEITNRINEKLVNFNVLKLNILVTSIDNAVRDDKGNYVINVMSRIDFA